MSLERYKDVTIGENRYRIGRFPALLAANLSELVIASMSAPLSVEHSTRLTNHCLSVCNVYRCPEGGHPAPVALFSRETGDWLVKDLDLEYDLTLVDALKIEVMDFNFTDFLFARAAKTAEIARKRQAAAPPSTTSR